MTYINETLWLFMVAPRMSAVMGHNGLIACWEWIVMWPEVLAVAGGSLFSRWNCGAKAQCLDEKRQFICRLIDPFAGWFARAVAGAGINADERW